MKSFACEFIKESSTLKVSISMETSIILPSFLLSEIIKILKEVFDEAAREVLRQIFQALDDLWLEEKGKDIEICKIIRNRSLKTIFGKILFDCRQAKRGDKYLHPLLETLGIDKYQRITDDLLDLVKRSALYTSYRKALKIGSHICSLSTLWKAVQKEGALYRKKRNDAVYYYLEGAPLRAVSAYDFAIVMIDEIWLCKKTKRLVTEAPPKKKKREYIKVKVARCSVAHKTEDSYVGEPLRVFATARGTQKDFVKEASRFFNATCSLAQVPRSIVLTDGCTMGKDFCALYREDQAVWQLDWWHLFNAIHKGCKFEKDLEKEVCGLIRVEKIDQALVLLHAYREAMRCAEKKLEDTLHEVNKSTPSLITPKVFWSTRQRELLENCITYMENKRDGIYGVKKFAQEIPAECLPFGTGPVERLQAVMVAYRSPLPAFCVPLLQRGRTDSLFTPLKRIAELKLVPNIVDFREEGCQDSLLPS